MTKKDYSKLIFLLRVMVLGLSLFMLFNSVFDIHNKNGQVNSENQSKENQDKILLELNHEIDWDKQYGLFGTEAETTDETINIVDEKLNKAILKQYNKETIRKQYNNEDELSALRDFIDKKFNLKLDNNWKYFINILNTDDNVGIISFIYCIDENIETNKAINFFFENGTIYKMSYSYLDNEIDEDSIISKVMLFNENTIQEKKKLETNETFKEEKTKFIYNYRINKTTYSYTLFLEEGNDPKVMTIDYGSEYIVEDFLKEHNL